MTKFGWRKVVHKYANQRLDPTNWSALCASSFSLLHSFRFASLFMIPLTFFLSLSYLSLILHVLHTKCFNVFFPRCPSFLISGLWKRNDVGTNAAVSRNTNGIDFLHTIRMMIAKESSWIGSFSLHAAFVDVTRILWQLKHRNKKLHQGKNN